MRNKSDLKPDVTVFDKRGFQRFVPFNKEQNKEK